MHNVHKKMNIIKLFGETLNKLKRHAGIFAMIWVYSLAVTCKSSVSEEPNLIQFNSIN